MVGFEQIDVDGRQESTIHIVHDSTITGRTRGKTRLDWWHLVANGNVVREGLAQPPSPLGDALVSRYDAG